MKKIIYILFTIELLIVSVLGVNIAKDNEISKILFKDTTSISIEFKDYFKLKVDYDDWIKEIAEDNKVSISKYVFNSSQKLCIYTTNTNLDDNIKLTKGKLPIENSYEFISNKNTKDKNQVGEFSTLDQGMDIIIRDFGKIRDIGEDGIFYVSTQDESTLNNILKELNKDREIIEAKVHDKYDDFNLYLSLSLIINIVLTVICLFVTIIHYSVNKGREVSILRLNGYSKLDIVLKIISEILCIMGVSAISGYILFIVYIIKANIPFSTSAYFGVFTMGCILINIIVATTIVSLQIRKSKYLLAIKGKKSHGLVNVMYFFMKFVFVLFLLISVQSCIFNYNKLETQLNNLSQWDKAKNVYRTELKYTGEEAISKEEYIKNEKLTEFYKKLVDEKDAFLINSSNYSYSFGRYLYELNSNDVAPEISAYGKNITINENYLKYNPIYASGKDVVDYIDYDKNTLNLLVPKKFEKHESEIEKQFLELFYFQKVEVDNMYRENLDLELNKTKATDLKLNIIYVDNNQSYFTYESSIMPENKNNIDDPIAIVDSINFENSYYAANISNSVYLKSDELDAFKNILPLVRSEGVESSIQSLYSLYDSYGMEINKLKKEMNSTIFTIIALFISNIMVTYNMVVSYYEKNKYKLYIKKLYGYSYLCRNIFFIISLVVVNIVPIFITSALNYLNTSTIPQGAGLGYQIINTFLNLDKTIILCGIGILIIEIVIATILDKIISNSSFNKIIKGEH